MSSSIDLPVVWAFIIAFAIFAYVVMDGFDLGIGILFPTFTAGQMRDEAMNAIAPVWDGNETWLVMGGGGLLAAFPTAYAIILPATYPLMIAMLLGLVFRGVAFEFRWRNPRHRPLWDVAFSIGSATAALAQGITLGAILQGVRVHNDAYAGGWLDWLSPFSLLTGVSVMIGYTLLGATWLVWKTSDATQRHARRLAVASGVGALVALVAVSLATPFLTYDYWRRWFAMPGVLLTAQIPLLVIIAATLLFWSLRQERQGLPFLLSLGIFLLGFVGLGISIYPFAVPRAVTIWDASSPVQSQLFMLAGAVVIIPLILIYTGWAYWVFRGKVAERGYH